MRLWLIGLVTAGAMGLFGWGALAVHNHFEDIRKTENLLKETNDTLAKVRENLTTATRLNSENEAKYKAAEKQRTDASRIAETARADAALWQNRYRTANDQITKANDNTPVPASILALIDSMWAGSEASARTGDSRP